MKVIGVIHRREKGKIVTFLCGNGRQYETSRIELSDTLFSFC